VDLHLEGKRAVIAGASSGLGLGCAQALAAEGATVAIGSRSSSRIGEAASTMDRAVALTADVSTTAGAIEFVERGVEALGGIDILIANAGGPPTGNFASTELEAYPDALALNLLSTVAMCTAAVPLMQAQGWGRVVAITSTAVRQPMEQLILSNTARAGVTAFLKTLATEVAADGVTVNSLQPGLHETSRLREIYGERLPTVADQIPARRLGDPADFGRAAAFLCSETARFITGVALPIDGGATRGLQ